MKRARLVLPLFLLVLSAVGCSWMPTSERDSAVSHSVSPGPGNASLRPQILEPTPGLRDSRPNPWVAARPAGAGRLLVTFWGSPCLAVDRVVVADGPRTVGVTLYLGSKPGSGNVCAEIAVYQGVYVSLPSPLGNQHVVDGAPGATPEPPGSGGAGSGGPPDGTG
jgi:hypothetical protein